jgi:hypothetical protein
VSMVIALRPIELDVDTEQATEELVAAMMAPVHAYIEQLVAVMAQNGPRGRRKVEVTVRLSPALRAVIAAHDAWELTIEEVKG